MKRLYVAAALALAAGLTHGADVKYDQAAGIREQMRSSLEWRTFDCMSTAAVIQLRQGERDEAAISRWVVKVCGQQLRGFLAAQYGLDDTLAGAYLIGMARGAIRTTPGVQTK